MAKTEKEIKVINGVEVTFYPNSHQYKIKGKNIPSVTTITSMIDKSRPLLKWAENLSREFLMQYLNVPLEQNTIESAVTQYSIKKDKAADEGTQVHDWISQFINSKLNPDKVPMPDLDIESPAVMNGITGFLKWFNQNNITFLESEKMVYSKKHNYIGTFDVLMTVNNRLVLGDWKTGKDIRPEFKLQLSAYHQALKEERIDIVVDEYMILHFDKESAGFKVVTFKPDKSHFKHFNNLLKLRKFLSDVQNQIQ